MKTRLLMGVLTALAAVTVRAEGPTFEVLKLAPVIKNEPLQVNQYTLCEVEGAVTYNLTSRFDQDGTGRSAVTVPDRGILVFNLKEGSVLTLIGDRGSDKVGGGAGLCVPDGTEVYVTGRGKLIATGGAGTNGRDGGAADDTWIDRQDVVGSRGGAGGRGGWGAGAGIGGVGGVPGEGGARPDLDRRYTDYHEIEIPPTKLGIKGGDGGRGGAAGKIYLLHGVTVTATPGAAGTGGKGGNGSNGNRYHTAGGWYYRSAGAGGGGGGGGGGSGEAIGGGGGGGGGGGSGSNGGFTSRWSENTSDGDLAQRRQGQGGFGGTGGDTDGVAGANGNHGDHRDWGFGPGGVSGAAGPVGSVGGFFCGSDVVCSAEDRVLPMPGEGLNIPVTIYLDHNDGTKVDQLEAKFMGPMPTAIVPFRRGYRFLGWFDASEKGNRYYGASARPVRRCCEFVGDLTLYAHWERSSDFMTVNSNGDNPDGTSLGEGKVTLRDAVKAIVENPNMVASNGFRRIEFDLPVGEETIELASELVVPAGTRPFEINGFIAVGRCVTIRPKEGVSCRLFSIGTDVSCRNVNFTGGSSDLGGALKLTGADQTVFVENCSFIDNRATAGGGAICQTERGTLIVMNSTFAGNATEDSTMGGAVNGRGEAAFVNCTFSRNRASGGGGALIVSGLTSLVNCTFAHNILNYGNSGVSIYCSPNHRAEAINSIFADSALYSVVLGAIDSVCCSFGSPSDFFSGGGVATTNDISGVRQIYYPPLPWESTGLKDAAEIYHDASYNHIAYVHGTNTVAMLGNKLLADIRLGTDQTGSLRLTPVRGAIRLASGAARSVVNLEGRLWTYRWAANYSDILPEVTINYDDGTSVTRKQRDFWGRKQFDPVSTDENGFFAAPIEVDGSDGRAHNVTSVDVTLNGNVRANLKVNTVPYALVAASAEYVGLREDMVVPGEANSVNLMAVNGGVVGEELTLGRDFTAGTVKGNADIEIDGIELKGGALEWFNGKEGVSYATLSPKGVKLGGGSDYKEIRDVRDGGIATEFVAKQDGFFQMTMKSSWNMSWRLGKLQVGLWVGNYEVSSPNKTIYARPDESYNLAWTVPVRAGEEVKLVLMPYANSITVETQFIYFGKED